MKRTIEDRWNLAKRWIDMTNSNWLIFLVDAFEIIKFIPDDSIDLVIIDPPYESLEKHRDSKKRIDDYKVNKKLNNLDGIRKPRLVNWFKIMKNEKFPELLLELYRIMEDDSHLYIFCDDETSDIIKECVKKIILERGQENFFKWWKRIIWDKKARGMGYHYANNHEFIVFLEKGKRKLNNFKYSSILEYKRVSKKSLGRKPYPTEKPVGLVEKLVLNSSDENETVLDLFCGSSSVGVACIKNNRDYLGMDCSRRAVQLSRRRLRRLEQIVENY